MLDAINSTITFPQEVRDVAQQAVNILEEQSYFDDNFDDLENARVLFFEKLGLSLIPKFIEGYELIWDENEFEIIIVKATVEHAINELERNNLVDVFEDGDGEKFVVLKK